MTKQAATSRRKRTNFVLTALLAALSTGLGCVVLEYGARQVEQRANNRPRGQDVSLDLAQPNPAGTGSFRLRPNLNVDFRVKNDHFVITTNSFGMRWREVSLAKPHGKQRIAFLGDSFAFGCWASRVENSFVGVVDRTLDPSRYEVLDFGVGGYGLDDMELQWKELVDSFSPDYVVVTFFNGNDFRDTFLGLDRYDIVEGRAELNVEREARKLPPSIRSRVSVRCPPAADRSWLRGQLTRLATFRLLLPIIGLDNLAVEFHAGLDFNDLTYWSRVPYSEIARQARDTSLAVLERMNAFAQERRAQLVLVSIPFREQVYAAQTSGRHYDIGFPQAYLQVFARDRGIPYLDLLPLLREHVARTNQQLYWQGDIHFNERGHMLVGNLIGDWLPRVVLRPGDEQMPHGPSDDTR